jgi:hypothetical protein
MITRALTKSMVGILLLSAPATSFAQWAAGSEIVGQSVQVETAGVTNTVYFDAGGAARIQTPAGKIVPGTWNAANGQLCLSAGGPQECWPYARPFQAGQQVSLMSSCNAASRWTALGTNQAPPAQQSEGERG